MNIIEHVNVLFDDCSLVRSLSPIDSCSARNFRCCRSCRANVSVSVSDPYRQKSFRNFAIAHRHERLDRRSFGTSDAFRLCNAVASHSKKTILGYRASRAWSVVRASHQVDNIRKRRSRPYGDDLRQHAFRFRNRSDTSTPDLPDARYRRGAVLLIGRSACRSNRLGFPFDGPPFRVVQRPGRVVATPGAFRSVA